MDSKPLRLTLRTMLAYLDDVLDAEATQEIGQKIQQSPTASAMVSRIREVMRKRRLAAPELEGPGVGVDPNHVAQYLDNTLPGDLVAEFERICLEADVQLAEVAACHQILTLALGEAVDVPPATLDRLYALGPVNPADQLEVPQGSIERNSQAGTATGNRAAVRSNGTRATLTSLSEPVKEKPFQDTIPDYLKPQPWSRSVLAAIGIIAIAAIYVMIILVDPELNHVIQPTKPRTPDRQLAQSGTTPATTATATDADTAAGESEETMASTNEPDAVATVDPATPDPVVKPAIEDDPDMEPPLTAKVEPAEKPVSDENMKPEVPVVAAEPEAPPPAAERPLLGPKFTARYLPGEGILLRYSEADRQWVVVPTGTDLRRGDRLAVPEPFEVMLDLNEGRGRLVLLSGTLAQITASDEQGVGGVSLRRGRVILQGGPKFESSRFLVAIGEHPQVVALKSSDAACGIEVVPRDPAGYQQEIGPDWFTGQVFGIGDGVRWEPLGGKPVELSKGTQLPLSAVSEGTAAGAPPAGTATPEWLDPQKRKVPAAMRKHMTAYEKLFSPNKPIDLLILETIKDPRPKLAEWAVHAFGLTGNCKALAEAMAQTDFEETRHAAANGLRAYLASGPSDRGERLMEQLLLLYPKDDAKTIYVLLWGPSKADARDRILSLQLVHHLRHPRVEVRELAFANIQRLTNRKFDYRPLASPQQREASVVRWEAFVEKEGGLVKDEQP